MMLKAVMVAAEADVADCSVLLLWTETVIVIIDDCGWVDTVQCALLLVLLRPPNFHRHRGG